MEGRGGGIPSPRTGSFETAGAWLNPTLPSHDHLHAC
jgi:CDK inhibitor PHO81